MLIRFGDKTYRLPRRIPAPVMNALWDWGKLTGACALYKAVNTDNSNQRWITVHPDGNKDAKGVPVLIRVNPDGTGTVVGGAGGSLNAMKLTRLRSPDEWRQEARRRRAAKRNRDSEFRDDVKQKKSEAAQKLANAEEQAKAEYIAAIAEAQGWEESVQIPENVAEQMPADVQRRITKERQRDALRKAEKLVADVEKKVLDHHNERIAAELGEVALGEIDTSAQTDRTGLGYSDSIVAMAEEAGLGVDEAARLAEDLREKTFIEAQANGFIEDANKAEAMVQRLMAGAEGAREADKPHKEENAHRIDAPEEVVDPSKIKDILMARQAYKQKIAEVNKERNKLGRAKDADEVLEIAKGVSLVVSQGVGKKTVEELKASLEADLHQKNMKESLVKLLSTIEEAKELHPQAAPAEEHINTGHYAEMQDVVQGIMQEPCPIDRIVADHLGLDATVTLLANSWKQRFDANTLRAIRNGLQQAHIATQRDIAEKAATEAADLIKQADEIVADIDLPNCSADDLLMVQSLNEQRKELLDEAASTLGGALGRLEFVGTLNYAMMGDEPVEVKASLGQIASKRAFQIAAAMGLEQHEYEIVSDLGNKYLKLAPGAEYKLLQTPPEGVADEYREAVALKRGDHDEDGWLPEGFRDPSQDITFPEAEAAFSFKRDLQLRADMTPDQIRDETFDFLDRALADNPYNPRAVRRDAMTQAFVAENVPQDLQRAYNDALVEYFPQDELDSDEQAQWYAERTEQARQKLIHRGEMAEDVETLGAQTLVMGDITNNAVHATLSEMPEAAMAFVPATAETRHQIQAAIRDYFWEHLTTDSREEAAKTREEAREAQARAEESAGTQTNIFGEQIEVKRGESEYAPTEIEPDAWERFVSSFASVADAHDAVRDHMRGAFLEKFAGQYAARSGRDLKAGTKQVPNWDRFHIGTMTAPERQEMLEAENSLRAKMGAEVAIRDESGRFLPGARRAVVDEMLQRRRNAAQADFGFDFGGEQETQEQERDRADRFTLGEGVEGQLRKLMPTLAANFRPGQAVDLPAAVAMDGEYAAQQRAIKLVEQQKRVGVHAGVGSGKTLIGLGAFTHLHKQGKATKGIFAVPSVVAGQFGSEALRFLEPRSADGTKGYRWRVAAGMPMSERLAAYKNPEVDMVFVTHQALRGDVVYEVAQARFGGDVEAAARWMKATPEDERRPVVQETLKEAGWAFDFSMIDEGHDLLNRVGKQNSVMANAIDDLTAGHEYHVNATGTPVKNDTSEAFDVLHKLRPDRYPLSRQKEFHRRFGLDTQATAEALQREMSPYVYATKISPDSELVSHDHEVKLSQQQGDAYREVLDAYRKAQQAEPGSPDHVAALQALNPGSFEGASDKEAKEIAIERGHAAAMLRDLALHRVQTASDNVTPESNAKLQKVIELASEYAQADDDGGQLPGIVFAHNIASCKLLRDQLRQAGLRVGYLTGQQNSTDKAVARERFHPPIDGDGLSPEERARASREAAQYDILVASDAAACGANLQRAGWLVHYDQPMTSKTHEQRIGRMHRIGQQRERVYVHNLIADTPLDKRNRDRVRDKYELGHLFQEPTEVLDDSGRAGLYRQLYHHGLESSMRKVTGTEEAA